MGEYTVSEKADKKIGRDMEIIVKEVKKIPGIVSIILTGSFSRGKGPVKINKKVFPYNDYDITVIGKKNRGKDKIDGLSIKISKKLGYRGIENFYPFTKEKQKIEDNFYIDMKYYSLKELKNLLPRIRNYELKNNSKILWGSDVRNLIPDYSLKEIPLSESAKLLLDRMSQLIEYYSSEKNYERECLTYFIQQAYAACCTSLLQLKGKYKLGYDKSAKILKENYKKDFPELEKKIPNLADKIGEFIKWKINPKKPKKNAEKEWFIVKNSILEVSKYFFSEFLNKKINNLEKLSSSILNMRDKFYSPYLKEVIKNKIGFQNKIITKFALPLVSLILKYKYWKRLKKIGRGKWVFFQKSPDLVIFSSLIYLIGSISKRKIDKKMLKKGKSLLNRVYPCKEEDWEGLSLDYANAYIAFFLQKI